MEQTETRARYGNDYIFCARSLNPKRMEQTETRARYGNDYIFRVRSFNPKRMEQTETWARIQKLMQFLKFRHLRRVELGRREERESVDTALIISYSWGLQLHFLIIHVKQIR